MIRQYKGYNYKIFKNDIGEYRYHIEVLESIELFSNASKAISAAKRVIDELKCWEEV